MSSEAVRKRTPSSELSGALKFRFNLLSEDLRPDANTSSALQPIAEPKSFQPGASKDFKGLA